MLAGYSHTKFHRGDPCSFIVVTQLLSHVQLLCEPMIRFLCPWGFSRQAYPWSGLPFPSPRDLFNPGIKPTSLALASKFFSTESPGKPTCSLDQNKNRAPSKIPKSLVCSGVHTFTSTPFPPDFNNADDKHDDTEQSIRHGFRMMGREGRESGKEKKIIKHR